MIPADGFDTSRHYDETQLGYVRLQTAVTLLKYLSELCVSELPAGAPYSDGVIRRLTKELEKELRAYVWEIAPDALPPEVRVYVRTRPAFTKGRPKKEPPKTPPTASQSGSQSGG